MDFGKGVVKPKSGRHASNAFTKRRKGSKKAKGTKAKVLLEDSLWYALVEDKKIPINRESMMIPKTNKGTDVAPKWVWRVVDLYCNAMTNPTYDAWYKKKDKQLKPKDKHHATTINMYWSTIKPDLIVYGDIKDDEFYLNH